MRLAALHLDTLCLLGLVVGSDEQFVVHRGGLAGHLDDLHLLLSSATLRLDWWSDLRHEDFCGPARFFLLASGVVRRDLCVGK